MMPACEESIRAVGTYRKYVIVLRLAYGRLDDIFLFAAYQSLIACMRVEPKYCNPWLVNAEVALQALINNDELAEYRFLSYMFCHISHRHVFRCQGHPEIACTKHHHHIIHSKHAFKKRCMTGVCELG